MWSTSETMGHVLKWNHLELCICVYINMRWGLHQKHPLLVCLSRKHTHFRERNSLTENKAEFIHVIKSSHALFWPDGLLNIFTV